MNHIVLTGVQVVSYLPCQVERQLIFTDDGIQKTKEGRLSSAEIVLAVPGNELVNTSLKQLLEAGELDVFFRLRKEN